MFTERDPVPQRFQKAARSIQFKMNFWYKAEVDMLAVTNIC